MPFCFQSVSKAFNYAIAATELDSDYVHQFIGHEPRYVVSSSSFSIHCVLAGRCSTRSVLMQMAGSSRFTGLNDSFQEDLIIR